MARKQKIKIGDQVHLSIGERLRGVPGKFVSILCSLKMQWFERRGELLAKLADADEKPAKVAEWT